MDVEVTVGYIDESGQVYYIVHNDENVEALYQRDCSWWRGRTNGRGPKVIQQVIDQQTPDYDSDPKRELGAALNAIVQNKLRKTGKNRLSLLEIGCANGPTVRHLNKHFPDLKLSFYGFELTGVLVKDFRRWFPQHSVIQGGVEEMLTKDISTFPHSPYDLFVASGTLCMVKPDLVPEVLLKASLLTDRFVFWDYLENRAGRISKDRPVMFQLKGPTHMLYANPFEPLLKKIGFKVEHLELTPRQSRTHGALTGVIVAGR